MSLKDMLGKKLTPELMTQITDALGDDFDYDMVPRTRLNKVIKQRNEFKAELEGDAKSGDKTEDDDDGDKGDGVLNKSKGGMTEKDFQKALKDMEAKNAQDVLDTKIQYAALDKLRAANAIDPDLVLKSGVIDRTKLAFSEAGQLTGFDEQLVAVTKDKGFLFKAPDAGSKGTGKGEGGEGNGGGSAVDAQLKSVFAGYGVTPAE